MIATRHLPSLNPPPYEPGRKLPVGPTDWRDPGGRGFVAGWLAHVEAGRIGGHLRPAAAPLEAGGTPLSEETRAAILANERVLRGGR